MMRRITLIVVLITMVALPGSLMAVVHDYAESVQSQNGDPSPDAQNSNVNDYTNQDEQVNLDPDSGVVKVLRTDEKININKFVTDFVEFENANPRELRHAFRTICRKEGGNADVLQDKVKNEYFLHVVCPEFQLPYLRSAAEALDVPWLKVQEDGDCNLYYQAKFRPIENIIWISRFYRSGEGYFQLDTNNNALYYNDQAACYGLQQWGLKQIDIPPNQVLLDVSVYEVDAQNDAKIGLDWVDWKNGPGRNLFEGVFSSLHSHTRCKYEFDTITNILESDVDNDYRYSSVQAVATAEFIDFLKVKGKARELIKTKVLAQSGHVASMEAVDRVLAINAVHNSDSESDETVVRDPNVEGNCEGVTNLPQSHERFLDYTQSGQVGVFVDILPFIGMESMEVSLNVYASSVTGLDANGMPVIDSNLTSTRVRLKDGEPFVIGGLKRKGSIKKSAKVPVLGSIPVLGWLFGSETNTNREKEVVVVVKPKFLLGAESDMELPEDVKTTIALVKGEEKVEMPKGSFGFDQWLLDSEK